MKKQNKIAVSSLNLRRWISNLGLMTLLLIPGLTKAQTLLAGWDFQTTTTGGTAMTAAPGSPTILNANLGSGTIYLNGTNGSSAWTSLASNPQLTSFGGTDVVNTVSGFSTSTAGASSLSLANNSANGNGVVFSFNMAGYSNLIVSYATRGTATGFNSQAWEYSTDGIAWTPVQTFSGALTSTYVTRTLTAITGLNNASTAYLRLVVNGATAATGNNRIDNIQLNATAVTAPPVVTSNSATATVGVPFSYNISATNSPTSYASSSLPNNGLTLNTSTGVISGTPTTAGSNSIALDATNGSGTGSGILTLTVNQGTQTISGLSATDTKTFGAASYILTATTNSGLPITYVSSNTSVASIIGSTVTINGVGSTVITASQAGDANWNAAVDATQTLTVNQASQIITFGALPAKLTTDAPFALTATSTSGLPITYLSSNTGVATIAGNMVTIVGAGTTTVTASQAGDANYLAASDVSQTQLVNTAGLLTQTITFNPLSNATYGDGTITLSATASSGLPVSYSSSSSAISIAGNIVTILTPGIATITAFQAGDANYYAANNVDQTLTINTKNLTVSGIVAQNKVYDGTTTATLDISAANLNTLVGSDVVGVTGTSAVFADANVASGIAVTSSLTLTGAQASFYTLTQPTLSAEITKANQNLVFGTLAGKFFGNAPYSLTATAGASGNPIVFTSDNTAVIDITGNTATVVGAGSANITAFQAGNSNYNDATVTQIQTVGQAFNNITFAALPSKVIGDAPFNLTATATSGGTVTFTSSNPSVADVVGNVVTIYSVGSTTITASEPGNANYLPATNVARTLAVTYPLIAAWNLTGLASPATATATFFDANLVTASSANQLTRGGGAAASTASNSFRTTGFQNNGIAVTNTDYFQTTLTAATGYSVSLSSITANMAGTAGYAATPGVSSQFAYSLDGTNFTLIGSPIVTVGTPASIPLLDVTAVTALQNVPAGTTITIRYYASGQTTTGGWGFNSPAAGVNGLAFGGTVNAIPPANTIVNLTCLIEGYVDPLLSPVVAMRPVALNQFVLGATATDCDVITVELRNAIAPHALATPAVTANININGQATATFAAVPTESYYLVVKHRSTVETWSANPIAITTGTPVNYNFTTSATQAYGNNMVDVNASGKFAFYSGDIDGGLGAGSVETEDYSLWQVDSDNFGSGYIATDLNGDGSAESNDYTIWESNANNFVGAAIP